MIKKLLVIPFILIATKTFAQNSGGVFNQPVVPGPDGVLLFMQDTQRTNGRPDKNKIFIISKDENGRGKYKEIAEIKFPASAEELEENLGVSLTREIVEGRNLTSPEAMYRLLLQGRIDTLGLYAMNTKVLASLGILYVDKKNYSDKSGYKVEAKENGATRLLYQTNLRDVKYTPFPTFRKYRISVTDSTVSCTWYAVNGQGVYADIFQTNGKTNTSSRQFIYRTRDTLFVSYSRSAIPGEHYGLYTLPSDLAGNKGLPSDTLHVIATGNADAVALQNVKVTDTLGSMLLTWKGLPDKPWFAGIEISKSHSAIENYLVTDTLPPNAVSWLDRNVMGGTVYYYKIEPIVYNLPNKPDTTPVLVDGEKKFVSEEMTAPQHFHASLTPEKNIRLSWTTGANLNLFAYYVFRGTSPENLEIISSPVYDTVYVDSLKGLNPGNTYLYAVAARDMNMKWGDTSALLPIVCPVNNTVMAPAGLSARYTEHGVRLFWNDVKQIDGKVTGFMIYKRKKGEKYFRRLMDRPWKDHIYTDTLINHAGTYEYGCTSIDARGNHSLLSSLATVYIPGRSFLYPPAGFDIGNSPTGIVLSVPAPVDVHNGQDYIIYRRAASEKAFKKIGGMPVSKLSYIDKNVRGGVLYVYAISLRNGENESEKSREKAIRRN